MSRSVSVCAAILAAIGGVLGATPDAHADTGMLPNGATITWNKVLINEGGEALDQPTTPDALRQYLNLAHCSCSQAGAGAEQTLAYEIALTVDTNTNRPAEVWVGTQCDDDTVRNTMCRAIDSIPDIDVLTTRTENIEVSLYDAINGIDNMAACQQRAGDAFVWMLVDSNGDNVYDYTTNQSVGKTADVSGIDTEPPPKPSEFIAAGAEGAISLDWTVPEARATDIYAYQALCVGPEGTPVLTSPKSPRYQTVRTLCGLEQDIELEPSIIASGDPTAATLTPELMQLNPDYICGDSDDPAATGMLIEGLENGVPYTVVLLTIDRYGNPTGTYFTTTITPQPATDFWEDLHDRGSDVEGGFCLLAETYGDDNPLTQTLRSFRDNTLASTVLGRALIDAYYATTRAAGEVVHGSIALRVIAAVVLAPLVAIALAWHVLTLPGLLGLLALVWIARRRRHWLQLPSTRIALTGALAAALFAPRVAAAQGSMTPYWEEDEAAAALEEDHVTWHAGIRLGPYIPDIDNQFEGAGSPYKEMFGGYKVLPMLDVDRILWTGFGQFGVGGSIGYMQNTANAWADGSVPGMSGRERSEGDENTFRVVPLALTATYRFTWLDDNYGIPVVPYVRAGLAYYLWWFRTNGDTSTACWDGTRNPACDEDKAIGGTAGFTGSIGLAIRAERIDADAATSMRQGGIIHAGFYGELSLAKVNGFGSDVKLSVGDTTWFAGANFEF